jgi:glycerol-3-phosphate dehydrogenase
LTSFSSKHRPEIIQQLSNAPFDVLVIGGGITGAGIALDASARGLKVALVEMQDFAGGTSSRSTKLIHGGLRWQKLVKNEGLFTETRLI